MTPTQIAGLVLIILGCLFALAGLARFIVDMLPQRVAAEKKGFGADEIGKTAELVTAIGKLPPFAISVVCGIVLIVLGAWLQQGHSPFH